MIRAYRKRADELFGRLLELYRSNADPYSRPSVILPEDPSLLPRNLTPGCPTEANYWFCLCYYMRGQVKSVDASRALKRLHEVDPELFIFEHVAEMQPEELREILIANRVPWMAKRISEFWVLNARDLVRDGVDDVRQLYEGEIDRDIMYERICRNGQCGYRSFQHKMADMLTYYLEVQRLIPPFDHPTPVDFQMMRLLTAHNVIKHYPPPEDGNYGSQTALAVARRVTQEFCQRHGVQAMELAAAIWLFGGEMCGNNPVGWMEESTEYAARSTGIRYVPLWSADQIMAFNRSCGACVVADTCEWAISSKPYYRQGRLVRERRRKDFPPPAQLFNPD